MNNDITEKFKQSRLVRLSNRRTGHLVKSYVTSFAALKEAQNVFANIKQKLDVELQRILDVYIPLKNAVSDVDWTGRIIHSYKITKQNKLVELTLLSIDDKISYWKFPSEYLNKNCADLVMELENDLRIQAQKYVDLVADSS